VITVQDMATLHGFRQRALAHQCFDIAAHPRARPASLHQACSLGLMETNPAVS
jgi:hypothetical protein